MKKRGKSLIEAALNELQKIEAFENANMVFAQSIAKLLGYTNLLEIHSEFCLRYHYQAGPWAEMLDDNNKINWI